MKKGIILFISEKMDKNIRYNRHRNEHSIIRFGHKARENLGLIENKTIELWSGDSPNQRARSKVLHIYRAYSEDLKKIKNTLPLEDYLRVGFVTSNTFNYLCGCVNEKADNVWVTDSVEEILVGADPEFALLDAENAFVYAGHVEGLRFSGELASDGPLAEIRPSPAVDVDSFINNIKTILETNPRLEYIDEYKWYSGTYYRTQDNIYPIGGHIHIGTPALALHQVETKRDSLKYSMFGILNYILNQFVGIPFMYIEGVNNSIKRRVEGKYGYGDEFRTDRDRLEYRVPSGVWLKHPTIAKAVVGTTKAIAEAYYKYVVDASAKKAFKEAFEAGDFYHLRLQNKLHELNVAKALAMFVPSSKLDDILKGNSEIENDDLKKILNGLKNLSTYSKYNEYIDLFIELVKYSLKEKDGLKVSPYFREAWKQNENLKHVEE